MKGSLALIACLLSGCATTYYNENLTDASAREHQRVIDEGYCTQVASGSVPMPAVRHYEIGVQNYQITGSGRTYGSDGYSTNSYYSGNVTAYPSPADSFSAGMANGMNIGAAMRAKKERDQVMLGCMYSLGWTKDRPRPTTAPVPKPGTDGERFFDLARSEAEAGDPIMQTRVADAYITGEDTPKDLDQAIYWLEKASGQRYPEASLRLAYIYSGQLGAEYGNQQLMLRNLKDSAGQGEGMAQSILASMYYSGSNGLAKDFSKALEWYGKASSNNDSMGFLGMGTLYALGQGVPKDPVQAHRYFSKSVELGNPDAVGYLKDLESVMTQAQIREAQGLNGSLPHK